MDFYHSFAFYCRPAFFSDFFWEKYFRKTSKSLVSLHDSAVRQECEITVDTQLSTINASSSEALKTVALREINILQNYAENLQYTGFTAQKRPR